MKKLQGDLFEVKKMGIPAPSFAITTHVIVPPVVSGPTTSTWYRLLVAPTVYCYISIHPNSITTLVFISSFNSDYDKGRISYRFTSIPQCLAQCLAEQLLKCTTIEQIDASQSRELKI